MTGELGGRVTHCERPVKVKSQRIGWSGKIETTVVAMICTVCDASLDLVVKADVGLPEGSK